MEHMSNRWSMIVAEKKVELLSEELVHRTSQFMFVWDSKGRVQCDCVIAFEKMKHLTKIRTNVHNSRHYHSNLPDDFFYFYAADFQLWNLANSVNSICYHPTELSSAVRSVSFMVPRDRIRHVMTQQHQVADYVAIPQRA